MADPVIAIGGENLIDQVVLPDATTNHPGGSPFNVALAAARQGGVVRYVTPISTDVWGDMLATRLAEAGVQLAGGRVAQPSTMARVSLSDGLPSYSFSRTATAERQVSLASLTQSLGAGAAALHTGSLALIDGADAQAWQAMMAKAYREDVLTSLDPNVRLSIIADLPAYRARIWQMVETLHILKLSDEDLAGLFPDASEDAAMAQLLAHSRAPLVVLTKGAHGAQAWLRGTQVTVPAAQVDGLVDTVGAGDTFMASLLVGLGQLGYLSAQGLARLGLSDTRALLQRAAVAAALNCQSQGCSPPMAAQLQAAFAKQGNGGL